MIYEDKLELSDAQDITGSAASEDILAWSPEDKNFGAPGDMWLNVRVAGTAFDSAADDGTLTIELSYDTVAPIDADSTVIYQTAAIAEAAMTAGAWLLRMPLPMNFDEDGVIGLFYTVAGSGNFTAGNLNAWISHSGQTDFDTQVMDSNIS